MRAPKPEWVAALRRLEGCSDATIRFNHAVWRWEFILPGADGIPRSQFWGWFYEIRNGQRVPATPDPETGMYAFRELDDEGMREALANLEKTYIANPWDGAGTTRKEVLRRYRFNEALRQRKFDAAGQAFADMAGERARRIRGAPQVAVPGQIITLG